MLKNFERRGFQFGTSRESRGASDSSIFRHGNAAEWGNLFDPVTQFEIIQTGFIGTLLGLGMTTDAFRVRPRTHGVYTDRKTD